MFLRWLLWSNFFMACSAAGWVILTQATLKRPFDLVLIGLAFLLALGFYLRDRLTDTDQADKISMPARTHWIKTHQVQLKQLQHLVFVGAVFCVLLRPLAAWPLLTGLGFALSYTTRWIPWRGQLLGWKHLPGMKMPFVAWLWTLTTVITPAFVQNSLWQRQTWLLIGVVFLLIMVQILLNDLRDVQADRISGTQSLPVLLGSQSARWLGLILLMIAVLLAWSIAFWPVLLISLYSAILLWLYQPEHDSRWRFWIEVQGAMAAILILII